MWNRPSEIHLDVNDLTAAKGEDLGVSKTPAANRNPLIGHENTIAIRHEVDEVEPLCPLAVWPAALEIRRSIDAFVERARGLEVIGDQPFERPPILGDVAS